MVARTERAILLGVFGKLPVRASLLVALALALSTATPAKPPRGSRFAPDRSLAGAMRLEGETWIAEGIGATVRMQRIDEEQRQAYFQHVTGATTDPFATRPGEPERFQTFLVEIENTGTIELTFRPESFWLIADAGKIQYPLGLDRLREDYRSLGEDLPGAYDRAGPALIEGSRQLRGGARAAGLLMYRAFEPGTKRFRLDLTLTRGTGDEIRVSAPYRRLKNEEEEGGAP